MPDPGFCRGRHTRYECRASFTTDASCGGDGEQAQAPVLEGRAVVGDVLAFSLTPRQDWVGKGSFGWVEFRLHEGRVNGEPVFFIRTDASDTAFAGANGLVYVPLLANALTVEGATKDLYLFEGDAGLPVLSSTPADADFTPAWRVLFVSFTGGPVAGLGSVEAVRAAEANGTVSIRDTGVVVNYPLVMWPGGQLPIDASLDSYLGTGQVIDLDLAGMTVTFKLHECFSGMRYIVTDTSSPAMAEGMHVASSPGTAKLVQSGAVDNIYVFANGITGSGVMGFQPAVFRNTLGSASWSPFWDHFTLRWAQGSSPRVLTNEAGVRLAIQAGEAELFNGTPDTHPTGFVVNCPVPVVAANTFSAS